MKDFGLKSDIPALVQFFSLHNGLKTELVRFFRNRSGEGFRAKRISL